MNLIKLLSTFALVPLAASLPPEDAHTIGLSNHRRPHPHPGNDAGGPHGCPTDPGQCSRYVRAYNGHTILNEADTLSAPAMGIVAERANRGPLARRCVDVLTIVIHQADYVWMYDLHGIFVCL
jgi:hypothetical protein